MQYIYLYSTPTFLKNKWFKIGQTKRDPFQRIKDQDNESNPEKLVMVKAWQVPDHISDKLVHKTLLKLGFYKVREGREWFELSDEPEKDIEAILLDLGPGEIEVFEKQNGWNFYIPNYAEMWWFKA